MTLTTSTKTSINITILFVISLSYWVKDSSAYGQGRQPTSESIPSEELNAKPLYDAQLKLRPSPWLNALFDYIKENGTRAQKRALKTVLSKPEIFRFQLLISEVDDPEASTPQLTQHSYRVDAEYFYPASAVKLFGSLAALMEWTELKKSHPWLTLDATVDYCRSCIQKDRSNLKGGRVTLEHELKKTQLVSSNRAFNRVFNITGQDRLHERLSPLFPSLRVYHRLSSNETRAECFKVPPKRITSTKDPKKHISLGRSVSVGRNAPPYPDPKKTVFTGYRDHVKSLKVGRGYIDMKTKKRIHEPMDFAQKNRVSFYDFQRALVALRYPKLTEADTPRIALSDLIETRWIGALKHMMSVYPRHSKNPEYKGASLSETRFKPMMRGLRRAGLTKDRDLLYFNKAGKAFGFHVDNAFIGVGARAGKLVDEGSKIGSTVGRIKRGIFVTVGVYVNENQILNDNKYQYKKISVPLLNGIGLGLGAYLQEKWSPP